MSNTTEKHAAFRPTDFNVLIMANHIHEGCNGVGHCCEGSAAVVRCSHILLEAAVGLHLFNKEPSVHRNHAPLATPRARIAVSEHQIEPHPARCARKGGPESLPAAISTRTPGKNNERALPGYLQDGVAEQGLWVG